MSLEQSIDRLAAAIEQLAAAVRVPASHAADDAYRAGAQAARDVARDVARAAAPIAEPPPPDPAPQQAPIGQPALEDLQNALLAVAEQTGGREQVFALFRDVTGNSSARSIRDVPAELHGDLLHRARRAVAA